VDWVEICEPGDFGLNPIHSVHDRDYINFLASCWTEWQASEAADKTVLLPATFALRRHPQKPTGLLGRAGYYLMDLSACIVEGTYGAALASANCALNAAEAVLHGERVAFAMCRPPGHHAGRDYAGGYCFINNAAVAAHRLSLKGKVALLDIDYHCGNGTQDIFYDRSDVLTISIHADPNFEYPHFWGYTEETGTGPGVGFHKNFPLAKGTDDTRYLAALEQALSLIRTYQPEHLVVSAGMDIHTSDPLGTIKVSTDGIGEIGKRIASLGLPAVVVMEGGYANEILGTNILRLLGEMK
jgi:acetoin utilization deacetylase AcuC-like enzyme